MAHRPTERPGFNIIEKADEILGEREVHMLEAITAVAAQMIIDELGDIADELLGIAERIHKGD